ncbi:MAG: FAD-linked oxidase C-terminal domain-containing protein [bacterium]
MSTAVPDAVRSEALQALRSRLDGHLEGELRLDEWTRNLYATDASIYRIMPLAVAFPRSEQDAAAIVGACSELGLPMLPRGDGSSLAGQTVGAAVVMDFSRYMDRVLAFEEGERAVTVWPGISLARINRHAGPSGLMFGPDPASADRATAGGIVGNDSTGAHSILYGMTSDHIRALDVVLADGSRTRFEELSWEDAVRRGGGEGGGLETRIYRTVTRIAAQHSEAVREAFPDTWRRVGGYGLDALRPGEPVDLTRLVAGSEGTLCTVLRAEFDLVPRPPGTALAVLFFDSLLSALAAVPALLEEEPSAVELMDAMLLDLCRNSPEFSRKLSFTEGDPEALLVAEVYGEDPREREEHLRRLTEAARGAAEGPMTGRLVSDPAGQADVWAVRKAGLGLLMSTRGDHKPIPFIEDTAVPPHRLRDYIADIQGLLGEHRTRAAFYAHASAGCLHIRPLVDLKDTGEIEKMEAISRGAAELVLRYGGTMSGEHGDGLARSGLNPLVFGEEVYGLFEEVKDAFDPEGLMNPGKIVRAPSLTESLRFGADYRTEVPATWFDFTADGGLDRAVEMCSGAGVCRKMDEGTMCPSFMATREEEHSTRGRANALRAVLAGEVGSVGLGDERLHQTLDLCLSCKACRSECPSQVDMARLKMEFLAHYHRVRGAPLRSRLVGRIDLINRLGSATAPLSNWLAASAPFRWLGEKVLGIDRRRRLPPFRRDTLEKRLARAGGGEGAGSDPDRVVWLLPDTFTEHNEPEVGEAAWRLIRAAGHEPRLLPMPGHCCGRPMLSKGRVPQAARRAEANIPVWASLLSSGGVIVGLEPSCLLTLRDEYPDLVPGMEARLVSERALLMDEWICGLDEADRERLAFRPPADYDEVRLLVHGHCHERALAGPDPLAGMLDLLPDTEVTLLDSGCCGMAGAFGYEKEHYELSMRIGEDRLAPAVRALEGHGTVVAPGTSCRQQIHDLTGRRARHPVEVLADRLMDEGT